MLLSATVLQILQKRGVAVSERPADPDDEARTELLVEQPILATDDDDDMGAA
jgi:CRISPR-associated protein Cst1